MTGAKIAPHRDGATLDVVVQPRSSRSELAGIYDGALRVRLAAPPVDGAANAALVELLASALSLHRREVVILRGQSGRRKAVLLVGMTPGDVHERLTTIVG
jgi:uncharacterized protein